jgi:hypothetical protein
MVVKLERKFNKLEGQLDEVLSNMDVADKGILTYKPSDEKWNCLQILEHLQRSESATLSYLKKKIPTIEHEFRTGFTQGYRSFLLKLFLSTPLKFKAPAGFADIPEDLNFPEVRSSYRETRVGIREMMEKISEKNLDRAIMKHPRIGPINALQTLDFLTSHFSHHRRQIETLLKAAKDQ